MSAGHTPETSFEFVSAWFAGAAKSAKAKGNRDSAQLWSDGLQHLMHLNAERDRLKAANAELAEALAGYVRAIAGPTGNQDHEGKKSVMAVIRAADDVARATLTKHQGTTA